MTDCCTFDNPETFQRECWQDGMLIYAYSAELFLSRKPFEERSRRGMKIFFGANVGEWKEGQMFGDHEAITSKGINT
jgi:hypothetical protein